MWSVTVEHMPRVKVYILTREIHKGAVGESWLLYLGNRFTLCLCNSATFRITRRNSDLHIYIFVMCVWVSMYVYPKFC